MGNISGRIDVVVGMPAGVNPSKVELLLNFGAADTVVATQNVTTAVSAGQSITLSVNTAAFKNGPCVLKVRATTTAGTIVSYAGTPLTLNNPTTTAAALLRPEYLRYARFQRVELLS